MKIRRMAAGSLIGAAAGALLVFSGVGSAAAGPREAGEPAPIEEGSQNLGLHGQRDEMATPREARARMRMEARDRLSAETQAEVRDTLREVLQAANEGNVEELVDHFVEEDRERIARLREDLDEVEVLGEQAEDFWEDKYGEEFEDGLEEANIPLRLTAAIPTRRRDAGDIGVIAQVRATVFEPQRQGRATVQLEREEGILTSAWKIDVPNSLDARQLVTALNASLENVGVANSRDNAYQQFAYNVFQALGEQGSGR